MASFETTISVKTKIKVILLGDTAVGKSSIIGAIRDQPFRLQHQATVGIDFFSKILYGNQYEYKLQFWDTAGQQRFKSIIPSYIRNAQVGVLVFDVGNRSSFQNIDLWYDMFREYSPQDSTIVMMGNKIDLQNRAVETQQGIDKATYLGIQYVQLSAKTREGIHRFDSMLLYLLQSTKFDVDIKSQRHLGTHIIQIAKRLNGFDDDNSKKNSKWKNQCCSI